MFFYTSESEEKQEWAWIKLINTMLVCWLCLLLIAVLIAGPDALRDLIEAGQEYFGKKGTLP